MQGETDAFSMEYAEGYDKRYDALLSDFCAEFGNVISKDCIFADGLISERWNHHLEVNAMKRAYAKAHKNCCVIETVKEGLTTLYEPEETPDIAHYDVASTVKLGRLFAQKIL
jgi:hypothetical protein